MRNARSANPLGGPAHIFLLARSCVSARRAPTNSGALQRARRVEARSWPSADRTTARSFIAEDCDPGSSHSFGFLEFCCGGFRGRAEHSSSLPNQNGAGSRAHAYGPGSRPEHGIICRLAMYNRIGRRLTQHVARHRPSSDLPDFAIPTRLSFSGQLKSSAHAADNFSSIFRLQALITGHRRIWRRPIVASSASDQNGHPPQCMQLDGNEANVNEGQRSLALYKITNKRNARDACSKRASGA